MNNRDQAIQKLLTRNVEEVIEKDHLEAALLGKKKLRVKHGIDPTSENIHFGRAVALSKLKEFQDLGHTIVLIIGDFTAQIGDPSDKLGKRPTLTPAEIKKNLKNYLPQIGKILDLEKCEVRYNSEWLEKLTPQEILKLTELFSAQQMIERRNFAERWKKHEEIGLNEFIYPLMQGYDSVAVKADVEIGGSDQLFNLLAGRKIQERYGQKPQDILTVQMLSGTDGRKMSSSWGNVINVADPPDEQFGKILSMHDEYILEYARLATNLEEKEIEALREELTQGANPKAIKERLAREIVSRYHGEKAAKKAREHFDALFSRRETPKDIPEFTITAGRVSVLDLAILTGELESKSEARRLITQGGLDINGVAKRDPNEILAVSNGDIIKIGKKKFFRLRL